MGAVYLAERDDEFRRRVTIKLSKYGPESVQMARRFQAERQVLANLNHPNIVTLFDGGATEDGRSYLVMDYVEGQPIDCYCEERGLSITDRLRLLLHVCEAVQHAHRHLIVHCDLKPSNILVTHDGQPMLLDFGIAKLLDPVSAGTGGNLTVGGARPFTPEYASPEQLRGEPVTTATDVYGLGLIAYQVLAGSSPHQTKTNSPVELMEAICVRDPALPSEANPRAAERLRGDLDSIVLKALRKEPRSRYGSAEQLAEDIRRHLSSRPVLAQATTIRYRARKFFARNRVAVIAAVLAITAIFSGLAVSLWQAKVARTERAAAQRRFQDVRKLTNLILFELHDAVRRLPGSTPVQEQLVRRSLEYLDGLAREAADDPSLQLELAEAYLKLGDVQGNPYAGNRGDTSGALASYRKALAIAEKPGPSSLPARRVLALAHQQMGDVLPGAGKPDEALRHARKAVEIFGSLVEARPRELQFRMDAASCYEGYGDLVKRLRRDVPTALESYRGALAQWEFARRIDSSVPRVRRGIATLRMKIADLRSGEDVRSALEGYRRALEELNGLPSSELGSVPTRRLEGALERRIADSLWELGDKKASLERYGQATEIYSALAALDPTDARAQFDLAIVIRSVGEAAESQGDLAGALKNYTRVIGLVDSVARMDPGNVVWRGHLAEMLMHASAIEAKQGKGSEAGRLALAHARRAVELTGGGDASALDALADAYWHNGNGSAAIDTVRRALAVAGKGSDNSKLRRRLEAKLERFQTEAGRND